MTSESTIKINTPPNYYASEHHEKNNQFYFEEIFDQEYTQENIFDELRPLVMSAVDGKNVCIFAYGQTGSGKTYTMQGDASSQKDMGIIPRSIDLIFELVERARKYNWKYTVGVQIYENYLEKVENLLNNDLLKEHGDFDGSETIIVRDAEEAFWSFSTANRNRQVRSTNCNEHSSRSHLIFTIKMHAEKDGIIRDGSLSLIDLAGS